MALAVLLVLALIGAVALAYVVYEQLTYSSSSPETVTIVGPSVAFAYTGTTSGYLSVDAGATSCPPAVKAGSTFLCTGTLNSSAVLFSHYIDAFAVPGPYAFLGASPGLPATIAPGASIHFNLTLLAPHFSAHSVLAMTIVSN